MFILRLCTDSFTGHWLSSCTGFQSLSMRFYNPSNDTADSAVSEPMNVPCFWFQTVLSFHKVCTSFGITLAWFPDYSPLCRVSSVTLCCAVKVCVSAFLIWVVFQYHITQVTFHMGTFFERLCFFNP